MKKTVTPLVLMLVLMLSVFVSAQADNESATAFIVGETQIVFIFVLSLHRLLILLACILTALL